MRLSLSVATPALVDVVVVVDDDATVSALARVLGERVGAQPQGLWTDRGRLDGAAVVSDVRLVDGDVVSLQGPVPSLAPPTSGWQLQVVSGPDSGMTLPLPVGAHELGRGGLLPFSDPAMSRRHALLTVTQGGATLVDLRSRNGTSVEGAPVGATPVTVALGQQFQIGDSRLVIVAAVPSDAAVEQQTPGSLSFVRAPRLLPSARQAKVVFPAPPPERMKRRFPWVTVIGPVILGFVMFAVTKHELYLLMAFAGPLMAAASVALERRNSGEDARKAQADYEREDAAAQQRLEAALADETAALRTAVPDAASAVLAAALPTRRLWERRRLDADALVLRVGTGDRAGSVQVERRQLTTVPHEQPVLHAVPATVGLREAGVLGVAGPEEKVLGLLRWLVLQVAVQHAPRDVALTLLAPRVRESWNWVRWLPHARPREGEGAVAFVGNDPETVRARVAELSALIKARQEQTRGPNRVPPEAFPAHVLVVDGIGALRTTPGLAQVLQDGPSVGVYAVCADEQERFLPEACGATAVFEAQGPTLLVRQRGAEPVADVLAERVQPLLCEIAARALAPLRDAGDDDEAALPDSVRLLDLLQLEPPTPEAVRTAWRREGRTTRMVLGAGLDGPFSLDLRFDGPHGLIAGTTGAGKSELLQTMIASLAIANRPDAMNFVLVDYKGGSAFKDCVDLPHTVGMVTDLDAHLVERALISLSAELKHREHWLADAGVKDIEDYTDLQRREPHRPPMPRLVIVIDEFASMARELPEFVTGLVNVAQRGRSLGIHLVLATQRPSGVVSPEIRANTNLRISLRVTDAADSADVLEAPDAARIPKSAPGRGFARLGVGALVPFQSGRVGGRRPGQRSAVVPTPFVATVPWSQLGYAQPEPPQGARVADDAEVTDLSVLVAAVGEAARAEAVPEQRRPWLPALPERLLPREVPAVPVPADGSPVLPFGVQDLPAQQQRRAAAFDLVGDGHLLVVGSARSGRSQLLRTLAAAVADRCSTRDLHVYGIDCGNGALLPLRELPHCGAVVTRTEVERATRLFDRLVTELERRQGLLAQGGFADVPEQRRATPGDSALPHVLLMIDRWEGFTSSLGELDGGRLSDVVLRLLREGASAGIHVVITGDRSLASGRISSLTDNKLVMRLADRLDYGLVGLNPRQLPEKVPTGRGFSAADGTESQVALLADDESAQGQAAVLVALAAAAAERDRLVPRALRPFRLDALPPRVTFDAAWELRPRDASSLFALVGVGGDELEAMGPDFASCPPAFVVAGASRSGKTTALAAMARSLSAGGTRVVIGAPRPSLLRELQRVDGVEVVTDAAAPEEEWRKAAGSGSVVLLLDDADALRDCPAAAYFREVVKGMVPEARLVLAGNADSVCTGLSGWQVDAKKARQGLLLSPQGSSDGDLIGVRLPRSAIGGLVQPGRGLLHLGDARALNVVVPSALGN